MKKISIVFLIIGLAVLQLQAQKIGLNIGDKAPEIKMSSPDGKTYTLSDLKGQMVLIDFWASWCSPCRRENPNVVKAYQKYKDKDFKKGKGFTVFGVSLDRSKEAWKTAIKQDGLVWDYHVSDLKHWRSEAAKIYQVRGIPANFLIDGKGVIIAKSLRGARLDKTLDELVLKVKSHQELENDLQTTLQQLDKCLDQKIASEQNRQKRKVLKERKKSIEKALKESTEILEQL